MLDLYEAIVLVVIAGTIGMLGLQVFSAGADLAGSEQTALKDDAVDLDGVDWVEIGSAYGEGTSQTVVDSRGYAYRFTGAPDSEVSSSANVDFSGNWTVMQGAWVNASATGQNMTVLAVGDPNVILEYHGNRTTAQWSAFVYDTPDSYRVNVTATDPTNASLIWVTRNETDIAIHRGNTTGESVSSGASSTAGGNLTAADTFHGRLDETRAWATYVNATQRADVNAIPTRFTEPATDRQARLLYDRSPSLPVYFSGESATASNVTLAAGFSGRTLEEYTGAYDSGGANDYVWSDYGPRVRARSGGRIEHAPVAYASYTFTDEAGQWTNTLENTISRFRTVFAVLGLVVVIGYLMILRQQ
jgi:hypothetical protein